MITKNEDPEERPYKDWSDEMIDAKLRNSRHRGFFFKEGLIKEKCFRALFRSKYNKLILYVPKK